MATTAETLRLRAAGFTDEQIEALDAFVQASVATKADVAAVRTDLAELKSELSWRMVQMLVAQGALVVALVKLLPG